MWIKKKTSFFGIILAVLVLFIIVRFSVFSNNGKEVEDIEYDYASLSMHTPDEYGGLVKREENGSFIVRTEDSVISMKWDVPAHKAILTILDNDGKSYVKNVKGSGKYVFRKGTHGDSYTFRLQYKDYNGKGFTKEYKRKFLEFNKLPKLMTLHIDTEDGRGPVFEKIKKPNEKLFGLTVINKNYKNAILNNKIPVKIRIRGNYNATHMNKSYKLSFQDKIDLLDLGEEYADKEWVLLGRSYVETYFGLELGKIVGMEWEPKMRFVNLMLNGDWKGLYILCESINRHPKHVVLDKDGFLIESDGYFWVNKGKSFKSSLLAEEVGFTFKYPKVTSKQDPRFSEIRQQIKQLDNAVRKNSHQIHNLIDLKTFVAWELAHEFMGTNDGYGSNMFFYKQNMDPKSKIKMGPLWDFDSLFLTKNNEHSAFWTFKSTYFPFLLKNSVFRKYYKQQYFAIAPTLEEKMTSVLENMKNIPGLKESWQLNDRI